MKRNIKDIFSQYSILPDATTNAYTQQQCELVTPLLTADDLFAFAIILANIILTKKAGVYWDDLADTNSMWDSITVGMSFAELKTAVKEAVQERVDNDLLD